MWLENLTKELRRKERLLLLPENLLTDKGEDTDEWAFCKWIHFGSLVQFDLTAHHTIQQLNNWNWNEWKFWLVWVWDIGDTYR
jgi:5'-nucleotidase